MKFHIFPTGPLCSLRRALLMWLLPAFVLVGAASAAFSYWSHGQMVSTFMDRQMQQLGDSLAPHAPQVMPPLAGTTERVHRWGTFVTQVYGPDGGLRASSLPSLAAAFQVEPGFHDVDLDGRRWRVYRAPADQGDARVQILQSGDFRSHLAAERAGAALAPLVILLPLAIFVLWGVARAVSMALEDIGRQAAAQDEHSIAELPLNRVPHEIVPLVASFNSLLTRLRDAFTKQRSFVQDAAHELRTPITAVALQLENVRRDMPAGACTQSLAQLSAGVSRAQRLVDQLLKMSRQEVTVAEPTAPVDLHGVVHESISALIALADQRNIDLGVVGDQPSAACAMRCSPADLRSAVDNLIDNALRYTPEGGIVDVRLVSEHGRAAVEVVDSGPGIPEDLLGRVFDRFFRIPGNDARGSGLGLSIAQSAAQRCNLRITLRNREDRSGLVARLEPT